jgi:hypothetical protein
MQDVLDAQLETIISECHTFVSSAKYDDLSDLKDPDLSRLTSRIRAALERISGRSSVYTRQYDDIQASFPAYQPGLRLSASVGVVEALRHDLKAGYLRGLAELLHGEIFGDLLEMADHLVSQGYKDAGAVVAGATLESHLKRLAENAGLDVYSDSDPMRPKKTDRLNAELAAGDFYSKLDQKSVTAWLDLRNKAAHGDYNAYTQQQVQLLIASVRDFITRHPA